jgi:hypothetical protein
MGIGSGAEGPIYGMRGIGTDQGQDIPGLAVVGRTAVMGGDGIAANGDKRSRVSQHDITGEYLVGDRWRAMISWRSVH